MDANSTDRTLSRGRSVAGKFASMLALAALVGAVGAGASSAKPSSPSCTVPSANAQPFLLWHDNGSYFLAPGGAFESPQDLQGWSMSGAVGLTNGNEKWYVHAHGDASSLLLPAGSAATSPAICVSIHSPVMRFFMKSGGQSSRLNVSLNYTDKNGYARTASLGSFAPGSDWTLSPQVLFLNYIAPVVGGQGQTSVSFTFFVPSGSSAGSRIDDLYIDPLKSQ
jgi:hypothetical protein